MIYKSYFNTIRTKEAQEAPQNETCRTILINNKIKYFYEKQLKFTFHKHFFLWGERKDSLAKL